MRVTTSCARDTEQLGEKLASVLRGKEMIALFGDLGAGGELRKPRRPLQYLKNIGGGFDRPHFGLQPIFTNRNAVLLHPSSPLRAFSRARSAYSLFVLSAFRHVLGVIICYHAKFRDQ